MQEEVNSLHRIREDEKGTDCMFSKSLLIQKHKVPWMEAAQEESVPVELGTGDSQDSKDWKLMSAVTEMTSAPPADQALQNRFGVLAAEECTGSYVHQRIWAIWAWALQKHQEETASDSNGKLPTARDSGTHLLRIEDCYKEMGSTWLSGAKPSLPTGWPTWWGASNLGITGERHDDQCQLRKWWTGIARKEYRVMWTRGLLTNKTGLKETHPKCTHTDKEVATRQHYVEGSHTSSRRL